jgi:hypothetical protein
LTSGQPLSDDAMKESKKKKLRYHKSKANASRGCIGMYYRKYFLYVYGTYFRLTPTSLSSIFDPHHSALCFPIIEKNESSIPPKSNILFSNVPPTQGCSWFLLCSRTGATASPDFLCTHVALQSENHAVQKSSTTMVTTRSPNPVQKNSPSAFPRSIPMMHHLLSLTWQGALTLRSHRNYFFEEKNHFHMNLWSAWISGFRCTGKKSRSIFDPANFGLWLPPSSLNVRGRECILV